MILKMMNIDYIDLSTFVDKDTINLDDLKRTGQSYGYDCYSIIRFNKEMKIKYNPETRHFKLTGSLPYFVDGQNFSNNINKLKEGIRLISDMLNINLYKAEVLVFEAGITFEIPFNHKEVFNSHYKIPGMETKSFNKGKLFENSIKQIKFYNASYRLKQNLDKNDRLKLSISNGYNHSVNYIRFESKYKKPKIQFKQSVILVEDVFSDNFINICKLDLLDTYQKIKKEGVFRHPPTKRNCSLSAIELLVLKEQGMIYGFNAEDLIKNKINSISDSILNKEDRKNRKRSLNRLSKMIVENNTSSFDLSNILNESLKIKLSFI